MRKRSRDGSSSCEQVLQQMRKVQNISGCATSTLDLVLKFLQPFLKGCEEVKNFAMPRVRTRKDCPFKLSLHGCVECDDHVFGPRSEDQVCPKCAHPRYNDKGNPHEICWFFPLREQLRSLMAIPTYRRLLMYENEHLRVRGTSNSHHMCDIYDVPRWSEVAGPPGDRLNRIVLHGCVDSCPAHGRKQSASVKPFQYWIGNLPPWLRYKLCYMLIHFLIPPHLKGKKAKKYYDWIGINEVSDLFRNGVDGVRVIVYGDTLDTPGRRELLNMQAVSAFYPCPHCIHNWQPGLRGQVYGGYRRYLDIGSPWRNKTFTFRGQVYEFRDVESRPPAKLRNDRNVAVMAARGTPARPFLGHKGQPFLEKWEGVDWEGSTCDKMHDLKLFCEMTLKVVVGTRSVQGMYKAWTTKRKDAKHRADCIACDIFSDFHAPDSSPPWRLSPDQLVMCDLRVRSMWWPHYIDPLSCSDHSFWTHSDRVWKACHKHYALLVIMPTCLRGCVPAVHTALLTFVTALRRLGGQVFCLYEARRRHFIPGLYFDLIFI